MERSNLSCPLFMSNNSSPRKEILCVATRLQSGQSEQVLALVQRGEQFVRPLLPDTFARKNLAELLLIRNKLPALKEDAILQELVPLLVDVGDDGKLQDVLRAMQASELENLLPKLEEEIVESLHDIAKSSGLFRNLVAQHLACRLAQRFFDDSCLEKLAGLVWSNSKDGGLWKEAAGLLIAAAFPLTETSLTLHLSRADGQLLLHASIFAEDRSKAICFAKDFFQTDLGISAAAEWPHKGCAKIFLELSTRLTSDDDHDKHKEKVELLQKAHGIDDSCAMIRQMLTTELYQCLLHMETPRARGFINVEGSYLRLIMADDDKVPADVLEKLTLEEDELKDLSARQLQVLSVQLAPLRRVDAARLAVKAAKLFAAEGRQSEAQDAFLQAFRCDRNNDDAADSLVEATLNLKKLVKQKDLSLKEASQKLAEMQRQCSCHQSINSTKVPPEQKILKSFVWNLSNYDFTVPSIKGCVKSQKFRLDGGGKVWLRFFSKGLTWSEPGWAACSIHVDKDVRMQASLLTTGRERFFIHDFGESRLNSNDAAASKGFPNFMPVSEVEGTSSITLRILSVVPSVACGWCVSLLRSEQSDSE